MSEMIQSFEVVEPTEADFKSMTEDRKSEVLQSNVNIAAALLVTKLINFCKPNDFKFLNVVAHINIDNLIDYHGSLEDGGRALVKNGVVKVIGALVDFDRREDVYSVIFAKNGKFSFLNESGELV